MIRIVIFWALFWGPPVLGNYHMGLFGLTHPRHQTFTSLSVKTQLRWNSQMSVRVQGAKEGKGEGPLQVESSGRHMWRNASTCEPTAVTFGADSGWLTSLAWLPSASKHVLLGRAVQLCSFGH